MRRWSHSLKAMQRIDETRAVDEADEESGAWGASKGKAIPLSENTVYT